MQNRLLLFAGYAFYGSWDWRFLPVLFLSTGIDFLVSRFLGADKSPSTRGWALFVSIVFNLGCLGFFKYFDFFSHEVVRILGGVNIAVLPPELSLALPVGISFYTLQKLGYILDNYYKRYRTHQNFLDFALYVCFFPVLLSGPIERSNRLMPQIHEVRLRKNEDFSEGVYHVALGLFKKAVLADNLAPMVNYIFSRGSLTLTGPECLMGMYLYTFQIYFDFSGYSHLAQGMAKLLGFDVMWNFKMPYFSRTPREFWNRWHISLSSWIRDYLYIPLGGNRKGATRNIFNLLFTMFLVGLWHGAAWTFIAWGAYHGLLLMSYRLIELASMRGHRHHAERTLLRDGFQVFIFFNLVAVGWLLFRSESIVQASLMFFRAVTDFAVTDLFWFCLVNGAFFILPVMVFEVWIAFSKDLLWLPKQRWVIQGLVYGIIGLSLMVFQSGNSGEFIYFRF
jgi:D-alanyl-lipoteichoic acid acyltransferase DltB (MBOAT superfamily)